MTLCVKFQTSRTKTKVERTPVFDDVSIGVVEDARGFWCELGWLIFIWMK